MFSLSFMRFLLLVDTRSACAIKPRLFNTHTRGVR